MAILSFIDACQALTFALRGRALTLVGPPLPVVGRLLAVIGDPIPLIGDAIAILSDPLAPRELGLPACQLLLAAIQLSGAPIEFAPVIRHDLP